MPLNISREKIVICYKDKKRTAKEAAKMILLEHGQNALLHEVLDEGAAQATDKELIELRNEYNIQADNENKSRPRP